MSNWAAKKSAAWGSLSFAKPPESFPPPTAVPPPPTMPLPPPPHLLMASPVVDPWVPNKKTKWS